MFVEQKMCLVLVVGEHTVSGSELQGRTAADRDAVKEV